MTTPSENGQNAQIPPCLMGAEAHMILHRVAPDGSSQQVCGKCGLNRMQIKLHGMDRTISHLVAAVMMMLNEYDDKYKPMMLNLLNAAANSGHAVAVAIEPEPDAEA